MNNPNEFNENLPVPTSAWADLVDLLGQDSTDNQRPLPNQITASDLSNAEIDDIELDSHLRTLGRINNSSEQFVDSVMHKVDNSNYCEPFANSRSSVPASVLDGSPNNDLVSQHQQKSPASGSQDRLLNQGMTKVLIAGLLGLSLLLALSIFIWNPGNSINDADSKTAMTAEAKQRETLSLKDKVEPISVARTDGSKGFDHVNLIDDPINKPENNSNDIAKSIVGKPLPIELKSIDDLLSNRVPVEPEIDPIAKGEAERAKRDRVRGRRGVERVARRGGEERVVRRGEKGRDKLIREIVARRAANAGKRIPDAMAKVIPEAELDWKLAINFDEHGAGTIKVNDRKISQILMGGNPEISPILVGGNTELSQILVGGNTEISQILVGGNARLVLLDVAYEVKRRFSLLEPALGKRFKGVVSIGEINLYFDDTKHLNGVIEHACREISQLRFKSFDGKSWKKWQAKFGPNQYARKLHIRRQAINTEIAQNDATIKWVTDQPDEVPILLINRVRKLQIRNRELLAEYNRIGEQIDGRRNRSKPKRRFASIDLVNRRALFLYPDEIQLIREVVGKTEKILQKMAKETVNEIQKLEPDDSLELRLAKAGSAIDPEAFRKFADSGKLFLPARQDLEIVKSFQKLGPMQLKKQLSQVTAIDIFRDLSEFRSAEKFVVNKVKTWVFDSQESLEPLEELLPKRRDLDGLPLVMGKQCRMDSNSAKTMNGVSRGLGRAVSSFDRFASRDPSQNDMFRLATIAEAMNLSFMTFSQARAEIGQALRTTDQILQIDHGRTRLMWVKMLGIISQPEGVELLVNRAKYDLVPEIRQAAVEALKSYPTQGCRDQLLDGLKYPWHVVAEHSAEALVSLDDQDALPMLVEMLKLDDPRMPRKIEENKYVQSKLVSVNHMRNCMLCHAPSTSTSDMGRGRTPDWDRPLPVRKYYDAGTEGTFVRADIVYLRQDFSVVQPVENHGPWPAEQRIDYLVQDRKLTDSHAKLERRVLNQEPNLNREAIVYALRELTDQQPADDSYKTWLAILEKRKAAAGEDKN